MDNFEKVSSARKPIFEIKIKQQNETKQTSQFKRTQVTFKPSEIVKWSRTNVSFREHIYEVKGPIVNPKHPEVTQRQLNLAARNGLLNAIITTTIEGLNQFNGLAFDTACVVTDTLLSKLIPPQDTGIQIIPMRGNISSKKKGILDRLTVESVNKRGTQMNSTFYFNAIASKTDKRDLRQMILAIVADRIKSFVIQNNGHHLDDAAVGTRGRTTSAQRIRFAAIEKWNDKVREFGVLLQKLRLDEKLRAEFEASLVKLVDEFVELFNRFRSYTNPIFVDHLFEENPFLITETEIIELMTKGTINVLDAPEENWFKFYTTNESFRLSRTPDKSVEFRSASGSTKDLFINLVPPRLQWRANGSFNDVTECDGLYHIRNRVDVWETVWDQIHNIINYSTVQDLVAPCMIVTTSAGNQVTVAFPGGIPFRTAEKIDMLGTADPAYQIIDRFHLLRNCEEIETLKNLSLDATTNGVLEIDLGFGQPGETVKLLFLAEKGLILNVEPLVGNRFFLESADKNRAYVEGSMPMTQVQVARLAGLPFMRQVESKQVQDLQMSFRDLTGAKEI